MKLNWGTGIAIFITLFIVHILFLVYKTTEVSTDLQASDYYQQELDYQDRIEAINNSKSLGSELKVVQSEQGIVVDYPVEFEAAALQGEVHFFKPDNADLDRKYAIAPTQGKQLIDRDELTSGWYLVKVKGEQDGVPYFFEETVFVNENKEE